MPVPSDYSCAACGSYEFVRVANASFELWHGGAHADSLDPVGELLVCSRCGKTELFVSDPGAFAARRAARRGRRFRRRD